MRRARHAKYDKQIAVLRDGRWETPDSNGNLVFWQEESGERFIREGTWIELPAEPTQDEPPFKPGEPIKVKLRGGGEIEAKVEDTYRAVAHGVTCTVVETDCGLYFAEQCTRVEKPADQIPDSGKMVDRIAELERQLAEVTSERDALQSAVNLACNAVCSMANYTEAKA